MSIWNSIDCDGPDILEEVALRENYTGADEPGHGFVDVAVATWFHDKIRVIVEPTPLLLSADEARELARRLLVAAEEVGART